MDKSPQLASGPQPCPNLPASHHPQTPGPGNPNPPQSDMQQVPQPSACLAQGAGDPVGREKPMPRGPEECQQQIRPHAIPSTRALPHLLLQAPPPKPGKPGLLIEPIPSCPRGSERARGWPRVAQQPRPDPWLSSARPRCFRKLVLPVSLTRSTKLLSLPHLSVNSHRLRHPGLTHPPNPPHSTP